MPKVNFGSKTEDQKRMEKEIIQMFGMSLTLPNVMVVTGMKSRKAAKKWLDSEELSSMNINGRLRWWASDVAKALEKSKVF